MLSVSHSIGLAERIIHILKWKYIYATVYNLEQNSLSKVKQSGVCNWMGVVSTGIHMDSFLYNEYVQWINHEQWTFTRLFYVIILWHQVSTSKCIRKLYVPAWWVYCYYHRPFTWEHMQCCLVLETSVSTSVQISYNVWKKRLIRLAWLGTTNEYCDFNELCLLKLKETWS